jgi:stearoyl-CoA desaturase (delta-9 desaturase)
MLLAACLYLLCGLSITAGYHRLFAHRSYRASAGVRWALLVFGAATFQNSALSWSADHRAHHADTDGPGDPHAIVRGVWFAHVEWLFRRREASADVTRLADLWAVRSIRLQHRWYLVVAIGVGLVLPTAIAAQWGDPWGGLFVAGFLRAGVMLQATFCVNSLAHLVGTARYDTRSSARDSVITALVTFGEGYHSFHHRFPFDYRNGVRWWQYDPSKWTIWTLAHVGLAHRLRTASPASVAKAATAIPHDANAFANKAAAVENTR